MKPWPQCVQCILDVRLKEIRMSCGDAKEKLANSIELLRIAYEEFKKDNELTITASKIYHRIGSLHRCIYTYYKNIKKRSIQEALKIYPDIVNRLSRHNGYEKFRKAVLISVLGNLLDTGVAEHNPPTPDKILKLIEVKPAVDHIYLFYEKIFSGDLRIIWLFDNAGEAILDKPLIDLLSSYRNKVIGIVKEDPGFQNDLTIGDVYENKLEEFFGIKILSTKYHGSSIHLGYIDEKIIELLNTADLVVAKGMAHYEYLSENILNTNTVHMLVAKCEPIAHSLGVHKGSPVILYRSGKY